jgi:glycosyltransferase involved in cell wall biosynthesis
MILAMLIRVAKLAHNKSILHAHWLPNGLVGVVVKKLKKCSLVVTLRGSDQKLLSIPLFNYLCKWILKNSDAVTTVSEILSKRIIRDYRIGEKTFFISNGVDIINTTLPEISESGRFKVLFVGNLTKAKGIYDLLESLTKFKGEKNFFVDIIGDGPEKKNLLRTINNNNLYKYVSFSGRLSPQKVQKRMLSTHCFVLPSHSEGSPNVVKEAMACARPVIATNVGGTPELIEHGVNGLLFEPGDNQTLREHITYLSENRKVAQEMGLQARQFIIDQDLTWENTANQYMKIYKNVNEKI